MKVILYQDVIGLGEEGDIKDVADGYARNYLLPKKLAVLNTRQNLAVLESRRAAIEARKDQKRKDAQSLRERLEAEEIKFSLPAGENGKLFGSVNNTLVAQELEKKGFQIEKKRIEIPEHTIRAVGTYKARIRLYDKEEASVKIVVEGIVQAGAAAEPAAKTRQRRSRPAEPSAEGGAEKKPAENAEGAPAAEPKAGAKTEPSAQPQ